MTRSSSTLATDDKCINIRDDKFDDFANFLAITAKHFIKQGYNINYISPINEPQVKWNKNKWQEGSFATNSDSYKLVKELDKAISNHNISSKIIFGEVADMKYLFNADTNSFTPDNIIEEFFTKTGKFNITSLKNVSNTLAAHDYWTAYPVELLVNIRKQINDSLKNAGLNTKLWASEYCILEKNDDLSGRKPEEKSINLGLYTARIIHSDLAIANASAWQWWTAVSLGEDVPIQLKPMPKCNAESVKYDGIISPTKMLWTTANYSFFIRPGMWRIDFNRKQDISKIEAANSLMGSAYTDGKKTIIIFINYCTNSQNIKIKGCKQTKGKIYITDIYKNLEYCGEQKLSKLNIPQKSVLTIVF